MISSSDQEWPALPLVRVSLSEIQPFLRHLGLDARQPDQLAALLGVNEVDIKLGLSRAQFAVVWSTMEDKQHTRLKCLANDIVARRCSDNAAIVPEE